MDTGSRRVIQESRFGTVSDQDIHYWSPFSDDVSLGAMIPIRVLLDIYCVYQRHGFLAGMLTVVGIGLVAVAIRALFDGTPFMALAATAFGVVVIWSAIWQTGIVRIMVITNDGAHFPIGVGAAWHESEAAVLVAAVLSRMNGNDDPGVDVPANRRCRHNGRQ